MTIRFLIAGFTAIDSPAEDINKFDLGSILATRQGFSFQSTEDAP